MHCASSQRCLAFRITWWGTHHGCVWQGLAKFVRVCVAAKLSTKASTAQQVGIGFVTTAFALKRGVSLVKDRLRNLRVRPSVYIKRKIKCATMTLQFSTATSMLGAHKPAGPHNKYKAPNSCSPTPPFDTKRRLQHNNAAKAIVRRHRHCKCASCRYY